MVDLSTFTLTLNFVRILYFLNFVNERFTKIYTKIRRVLFLVFSQIRLKEIKWKLQ